MRAHLTPFRNQLPLQVTQYITFLSNTLSGKGKFVVNGASVTFPGTLDGVSLSVNVGTLTLTSSSSLFCLGDVILAGGILISNLNLTVGALTMTGGTLDGTGTIFVSHYSTWNTGTIQGKGELINDADVALSSGCLVTHLEADTTLGSIKLSRNFLNRGNLTFNSGGQMNLSSFVDNRGTIKLNGYGSIRSLSGSASLQNFKNGTIRQSLYPEFVIEVPLVNYGLVQVLYGTLSTKSFTQVIRSQPLKTHTLVSDVWNAEIKGGSLAGQGTVNATVINSGEN